MIIPTADFNPMFADDGVPFREKMLAYIQQEFGDLLASQPAAAAAVWQLAQPSVSPATATLPWKPAAATAEALQSNRQDRAA